MAKGHCELGSDTSVVGAASCVKYVNAATERLSMAIIYYIVIRKLFFFNHKRCVHFFLESENYCRCLCNMTCSYCLILAT